uniref:Nuclear transcription factor Y subunit n=1 Tax=Panagrellus redivivus TaxID=6233 RepID=A0A7E4VGF6_PANRE
MVTPIGLFNATYNYYSNSYFVNFFPLSLTENQMQCEVPKLDPWDPSIANFVKPYNAYKLKAERSKKAKRLTARLQRKGKAFKCAPSGDDTQPYAAIPRNGVRDTDWEVILAEGYE